MLVGTSPARAEFLRLRCPRGTPFQGPRGHSLLPKSSSAGETHVLLPWTALGLDGKQHPTHRHPGRGAGPLVLTSGGRRGRGCPGCGRAPVRVHPWSSARFPSRPIGRNADVPGGPLAPPQEGPRSLSRSTSLVCRFTSKGGSLVRFRLRPAVPGTLASTRCVSR